MPYIELEEEMECPCPCQHCGEWFDLHDGSGSEKWYHGTVICKKCHREEEKEIERDEEIQELQDSMSDAEHTLTEGRKRLKELGVEVAEDLSTVPSDELRRRAFAISAEFGRRPRDYSRPAVLAVATPMCSGSDCQKCQPVMAQGLPVDETVPLRSEQKGGEHHA